MTVVCHSHKGSKQQIGRTVRENVFWYLALDSNILISNSTKAQLIFQHSGVGNKVLSKYGRDEG